MVDGEYYQVEVEEEEGIEPKPTAQAEAVSSSKPSPQKVEGSPTRTTVMGKAITAPLPGHAIPLQGDVNALEESMLPAPAGKPDADGTRAGP